MNIIEYISLFFNNRLSNIILKISSIVVFLRIFLYILFFEVFDMKNACSYPLAEILFFFNLNNAIIILFKLRLRDSIDLQIITENTIQTYLFIIITLSITELMIFMVFNIYVVMNNTCNYIIQQYCIMNVIIYYLWDIIIKIRTIYKINKDICQTNENRERRLQPINTIKFNTINQIDLLNTTCPICLMEFEDNNTVSKLSCNHIYHPDCINEWINENEICPICRFDLIDTEN